MSEGQSRKGGGDHTIVRRDSLDYVEEKVNNGSQPHHRRREKREKKDRRVKGVEN